jgi:hypothetical protein
MKCNTVLVLLGASVLGFTPLGAPAAPTGLAWDSIVKIAMNADPSSLQPGDFTADFAAASATQVPQPGTGGGVFGQLRATMAAGQTMQQLMQNGTATHEYVAGSKTRIDMLSMQTAIITDCSARTITTLDLRRKTYKTTSMDQVAASGSGAGGATPNSTDTGTHVAITLKSTTLGTRDVGGQTTNGYRSEMTMTETSSSGESQTEKATTLAYYSSIARPSCASAGAIAGSRAAIMGRYARLMQALSGKADPQYSVTQSGPPLPMGKLEMYDATTFLSEGRGSMTFITERGNVHSISADDPVFGIPTGFTQQQ